MQKLHLSTIVITIIVSTLVSLAVLKFNEQDRIIREKTAGVYLTEISSTQLVQKMQKGDSDFLVLDVRDTQAYKNGHIKGAINIPNEEIEKRYGELPKDKTIITYCWSSECMLGPTALYKLAKLGFTNIKELRVGWNEWSQRKYPAEQSATSSATPCGAEGEGC